MLASRPGRWGKQQERRGRGPPADAGGAEGRRCRVGHPRVVAPGPL